MKRICHSMLLAGLLLAGLLLAAKLVIAEDEVNTLPKFTVGKDTTSITEPLTKDGYPDYSSALNKMLSQGVTAENNSNVLFWQAHGPHPERAAMPAEFFELMGVESPPEVGQYFVDLHAFLANKGVAADGIEKFYEQQSSATTKPWKAGDYPEIAAWLMANEKPLAIVVAGAMRSKYFSPVVVTEEDGKKSGMIGVLLPAVQSTRGFARALSARAMLKVGEGKSDEAWQDLQTCHRLARHIARGATLIEGLVGFAIEGIAVQGDLVLLENSIPMRSVIAGYQRDLNALPPLLDIAEKIDVCERFMFLDSMFLIARGQGKMFAAMVGEGDGADFAIELFMKFVEKGIDWDVVLKMGNEWYDRQAVAMREPDRQKRTRAMQEITRDLKVIADEAKNPINLAKLLVAKDFDQPTGRMFGSIMISLILPAMEAVQNAEDRSEQQQRNLHLAFALAAYWIDHDRYPAELDELRPKYIAKVPADLFTDKPLVYRVSDSGYLLYSLGPNGKDDGGNYYDDQPSGDDLRVRVPSQKN